MRVLEVKGNTEAEENAASTKWKGYITASIAVPLERAWQIGSDFSGLHKFVPIVEVCERLKGCNRTPGCLRFYTMSSATGLPGGKRKAWARDRLLSIDEETHSYTYAVEGSNMHLENCQVSFTASDGKDGTTIVRWAWEVDPLTKSTKEKTLGDMSEFACTFIKGLEAATASSASDSIDFSNFEGAPLDTFCGDDDDDDDDAAPHDDDGDGAGRSSDPPPVLSLMKSRLETLSHSLNKISQKLENGPVPPDLYHNELESLESILAEGRQSLLSHLNGSVSDDTRVDKSPSIESTSNQTVKGDEHNNLLSTTAKTTSPTAADPSSCRTASEECRRNCLNAISRLGKGTRGALKGRGQCSSSAMLPPLSSTDEGLRVDMDKASRGAYEAFQDFSNQFHSDLRDDISHQLESVEARLDCMSGGMKDGTPNVRPNGDRDNNDGFCSRPTVVSHESQPQKSTTDANWYHSPNGTELPPPLGNQTGHWELDGLQGPRSQGSPKGMPSLRVRSGLLVRDPLEEMSHDSDQAIHQEPQVSPRTFEFTNSFRDLKVTLGCASCCQTRGSSNSLNITNVPKGDHLSESGTCTLRSPLQDDNDCPQGGDFEARDHQHVYELETGKSEQGLKMDHGTPELRRRTIGPEGHMASAIGLMLPVDSSSQQFQSSEESGEDFQQQLQDSPQGWKHRGSKMRRTALNLEADLSRLQIPGRSKLQEGRPEDSGDGELFHSPIRMPRPSRLPPDIWPHFSHEEAGLEGDLVKERARQDNSRRKLDDAHDLQMFELSGEEFRLRPATQRTRAVQREKVSTSSSSSSSSSSSRSSKNYKKLLKCQCLPPRFPPSGEPQLQTVAGGLRNPLTSPISSLESPVSGSPSGPRRDHQQSECPLSALHAFGQCPEHVMVDLRNKISPGVFHSRQGQQTRVIIDIPEDLESREASRRQLNSLIRKAEIYKEFALLGIQKPPTEEQLLADFKSARYKKQQQQAISETEISSSRKASPPAAYQPYYADGRVFPPDAGPSPRNVDKSRFELVNAHNVEPSPSSRLPNKAKSPGGQNVSPKHSSEPQVLSGKSFNSLSRPPNGRIMAKGPQSEQQLNNATNSFEKNGRHKTSQSLRGATTARELAVADSKSTKPPRGGFQGGHPGSKPRLQSDEGPSCRLSLPMQKREIPGKLYGRRAPPAGQPFNSKGESKPDSRALGSTEIPHQDPFNPNGEAKPDSRAVGSTESPQVQPSSSYEGKSKPYKNAVSNCTESSSHMAKTGYGDAAYSEHKSLGSGDPFIHQQTLHGIGSDFSTFPAPLHPQIRIFSQADNQLKNNDTPPAIALHTGNSPRSSSEGSIAKILINFGRGPRESRQLELTRYRPPTISRQGSLDELVNSLPSESGSSVFDPYRRGGKFGSVDGSSGSDSMNLLPFSRQLHIADLHRNPTPTTPDESPTLTDGQSNSLTQLLHFHETHDHHHPNILDSSMYVDHHNRAEAQLGPNAMTPSGPRCHDCPFRQLKNEVDELILSSEPGSPRPLSQELLNVRISWAGKHPHHSPSCSRIDGEEPSSTRRTPPFVANPDGMPKLLMQQSDFWKPPHHLPRPQRHILDEVSRQLDAKFPKSFRDAETQTDGEPGGEGLKPPQFTKAEGEDGLKFLQSTQPGTKPEGEEGLLEPPQSTDTGKPESEEEGLRALQHTQILDEMASSAAELTDDPQAHTRKVDELVQQTGDAGLMSSWNAKKKRRADELAVRTRSTITMLNSAFNVREFTEDSRSYSTWLDGAAQQQNVQPDQGNGRKSLNSETQTSQGASEEPESGEEPHGEPRFREDSAANFIGSVAGQILHEFSETHQALPDEEDPLEGPQEPRFREDSAANFLGSISQKILQEFTDYTPDQSQALDQSEGPRERRFREQSALKFLEALSDQLLPEFKNRRGSRTGETSEGGGRGPRYRESSAINFLDALRGLVMENSRPDSLTISEFPSWSDQNAPSEVPQSMSPTEDSGDAKPPEEEPFLTEGWNYQPQSEDQVSPGEGLSYQPGSEGQGTPGEGLSYQVESEDQRSPGESMSQQPESVSQGSQGEGFTYQPDSQGQGSPDGGLGDQSEGEGSPHGTLSYQPGSEGQESADLGMTYQPESELQGYPDGNLTDQPESEGQKSPEEGVSDHQPESSVGEKSPEEGWSDQPESESQKSPDGQLRFTYQPDSQGQGSHDGGLGDQSEGQGSPYGALSYQPGSEGQESADLGMTYQPESELQGYPDGNLTDRPESEGQKSPEEGWSDQPESEGQASTDGGLNYQPETELQEYPDGGMSDRPESEGQGSPEENVSYQPDAEDQAYPDESASNQTDGSTTTPIDPDSQNESRYGAGRRSSQAQLGAVGPRGSRRSSQVAVLNEMLQDLHATVSRSRQNSVSNPGGS